MVKFDHMNLPVTNYQTSRDWYVRNFGFKVEFEVPDRKTSAIQDDAASPSSSTSNPPNSPAPNALSPCKLTT